MKKNAIASILLAFATAFVLAGNLGTASLVGDLSSTNDHVYTADQADAVFATRVPTSRTVNGKSLTGNITIGEEDITVTPGGGSGSLSDWVDSVNSYLGQIVPEAGTMLLGIKDGKLIAGTSSAVQSDLNINGTNVVAAIQSASAAAKAYTDSAVAAGSYTHPSYTARTGKPTANASPTWGGSFTVSQIKSDAMGHVTDAVDRTITIPSATATTSANGLMSSADKTALNSLASGAVTKTTVGAALSAQGIASTDNIDTLNETIAELKKVIAALEALK